MTLHLPEAVRAFVDGLRELFRELYKTPPSC